MQVAPEERVGQQDADATADEVSGVPPQREAVLRHGPQHQQAAGVLRGRRKIPHLSKDFTSQELCIHIAAGSDKSVQ